MGARSSGRPTESWRHRYWPPPGRKSGCWASGLARVAARHGIGPEDVVVFGDMPNDIAAFEWVRAAGGRAVAMAHAHPDLMAVATDVTGTNEDDGVAAFLAAL